MAGITSSHCRDTIDSRIRLALGVMDLKTGGCREFMTGPVTIRPQDFADVLKRDGEPVKYVQKLRK